jgi:CHASE3 domain sensor protein
MAFVTLPVRSHRTRRWISIGLVVAAMGGMSVMSLVSTPQVVRAEEEAENNPALKAVGGLAVGFAYQTHVSIGMVGDAFAGKVYKKDQSRQLLQLSINLIDAVTVQMQELVETELTDEDKEVLEKMIEINRLMKEQAEGLQAFIKSGDEEGRDQYTEAREQTKTLLDSISGGGKKEE